ncbi:MAG: GNAT family N-acetyltransferase [Bacteroidota bacterium]
MRVVRVDSKPTEKRFLDFPRRLYRNDPNFVIQFDSEVKKAFNRKVNSYFQHGDAQRWIVVNDQNRTVGRIAAFYDRNKNEADDVLSGGCGFFESVDDRQVASLLFDTAKAWLGENGYEAMTGPINFGENDSNWGCLVQGFLPPAIGMTYNLPYYRNLFESYGFNLYYRQLSFQLDLDKPFPERFYKIAEWINNREGYSFQHFDLKNVSKFVADTVSIYNDAWRPLREDHTPMDPDSLHDALRKARPILDPEFIWFAYKDNKPIAFFMFLPDANQIFRHLNGKMHLVNKLRFLLHKRRKSITRARGTAAGVVPKYQNSGVESGIFWQMRQVMDKRPHYKHFELSWVGDFNSKMIALYQATGAHHTKTHHTYRYLFDREKPYKRFMEESVDESQLPPESLVKD